MIKGGISHHERDVVLFCYDKKVLKTTMNDDEKSGAQVNEGSTPRQAGKNKKITNSDISGNGGRDTSKGTGNEREARLETALRANLRKRKQQARARSEPK